VRPELTAELEFSSGRAYGRETLAIAGIAEAAVKARDYYRIGTNLDSTTRLIGLLEAALA
jgi:hypothetical protein